MSVVLLKNSFVSLEEAEQYFVERFGSSAWAEAAQEDKEKVLITATKRINKFSYVGYKKDVNQPLEFPRSFGLPQDIKDAVCEEALSLIEYVKTNGETALNDPTYSLQSFKLGDVSVTTASSSSKEVTVAANKQLLSENANTLISKWTKKGFNFSPTIYKEVY